MPKSVPARETPVAPAIRFSAQVERIGDRHLIRLPPETSARLPSRGQVAARAVLNGHAFETVIEPDGRRGHWLSLGEPVRAAASVGAGHAVDGELIPRKDWPEPQLPKDLRAALEEAPDLDATWKSLTPMARWEWVRWVCATRNPETRARRVEVSISKLRGGKRRPCCFDLSSCTDPGLSRSGKLMEPTG